VVIHYADQNKIMCQIDSGFAGMVPERMRQLVQSAGYVIVEEDTTSM
jgi:hypothetical protein